MSVNPSGCLVFGRKGVRHGLPGLFSPQTCPAMATLHCVGQRGMQCVALDSVGLLVRPETTLLQLGAGRINQPLSRCDEGSLAYLHGPRRFAQVPGT